MASQAAHAAGFKDLEPGSLGMAAAAEGPAKKAKVNENDPLGILKSELKKKPKKVRAGARGGSAGAPGGGRHTGDTPALRPRSNVTASQKDSTARARA